MINSQNTLNNTLSPLDDEYINMLNSLEKTFQINLSHLNGSFHSLLSSIFSKTFTILKQQYEVLTQIFITKNTSNQIHTHKDEIISTLIINNSEQLKTELNKFNTIIPNNAILFDICNQITFSYIPSCYESDQIYFESFGNLNNMNSHNNNNNNLVETPVSIAQLILNNNSNNSNFTFKNSTSSIHQPFTSNSKIDILQLHNCNTNESKDSLEQTDNNNNNNNNDNNSHNNYIKLTNDDIISKIKSKLTSANLHLNEISFEMDSSLLLQRKNNMTNKKNSKQINKLPPKQKSEHNLLNNSRITHSKQKGLSQFVNSNNNNNNSHFNFISNELSNSPIAPSNYLNENTILYSNRTLSGKRKSKTHRNQESSSVDIKNSKRHLNDISITTETTFSSKRNYRQNSSGIMFKKGNNDIDSQEEIKKKNKQFYKNIKNVKSKYGDFINISVGEGNGNRNNRGGNNIVNENRYKGLNVKGVHLEQYINMKISEIKRKK